MLICDIHSFEIKQESKIDAINEVWQHLQKYTKELTARICIFNIAYIPL